MDLILLLKATCLSIIEALTEFLPISSTAHLIIFSKLVDFENSQLFEIIIQFGAILAVCFLYRERIYKNYFKKYFKCYC